MAPLPDQALARLRRQHGLVTRRQLLAAGCSPDAVDGLARRRGLERVHRGVYRLPGGAVPPEQPLLAAVLRCGRDARAAGESACALHGLEGFDLAAPPRVVVPPDRGVRGRPCKVGFGPLVQPADRATVSGIPAVSAARALIDVAARTDERRLLVAIDSARRAGLLSVDWLPPTRGGARQLVGCVGGPALLRQGSMDPESEGERALARLLAGDPAPHWGRWLLPGIRVDAVHPDTRLVVEYDGFTHHTPPAPTSTMITAAAWRWNRPDGRS